MTTKDTMYVYGKISKNSSILKEFPHPNKKGYTVQFVKNVNNNKLYFNLYNLIAPYNSKVYLKILKHIFPKAWNYKDVWMCSEAWTEIKKGIDKAKLDIKTNEKFEKVNKKHV